MPHTDLPLDDLRDFRPDVAEPAAFDDFWRTTLDEARALASDPVTDSVASPFEAVTIEDLRFSGFGGDPVRAWITRPRETGAGAGASADAVVASGASAGRPAVVEFIGYGGGRGLAGERLHWAAAGYVHVLMDTRGQGSAWGSGGGTADPHGSGPAVPGVMTRGIESPETYFYRRMFTDAVLLTELVRTLPGVDPERVAVTGVSQGGGTALAVGGLVPGLAAVMPDVPFLCCFRRSVQLTPLPPVTEITQYLAVHRDRDAQVYDTLSYFDGVNFARRASAPALFSVALMDEIVLPSTVFAAYNHYAGADRDIAVYEHNGHEGGELHQWYRQAAWLGERTARA